MLLPQVLLLPALPSIYVLPQLVLKPFFWLVQPFHEPLQLFYEFLQLYSPLIETFAPIKGFRLLITISHVPFQLLHQPVVVPMQTQSLPFPGILFQSWLVLLLHVLQQARLITPTSFDAFLLLFSLVLFSN